MKAHLSKNFWLQMNNNEGRLDVDLDFNLHGDGWFSVQGQRIENSCRQVSVTSCYEITF